MAVDLLFLCLQHLDQILVALAYIKQVLNHPEFFDLFHCIKITHITLKDKTRIRKGNKKA